jgi:hypothetical protein
LQLLDLFPRLTGARFVASSAAIFDFDFHDLSRNHRRARRAHRAMLSRSFDTNRTGLTSRNLRPGRTARTAILPGGINYV